MESRAPTNVFLDNIAVTFQTLGDRQKDNYCQPEKELMLAVLKVVINPVDRLMR
jgi:hypothetical protein